jgi:hypothetical protein
VVFLYSMGRILLSQILTPAYLIIATVQLWP